jgi:hypothetical protein
VVFVHGLWLHAASFEVADTALNWLNTGGRRRAVAGAAIGTGRMARPGSQAAGVFTCRSPMAGGPGRRSVLPGRLDTVLAELREQEQGDEGSDE